jgi:C4-dicarboxylate-specific signal transduction histidine kinase
LRLLLKKGEIQMQPIEINELVQEVLRLVRSDLIHHDVVVQTDFASDLPRARGDAVQIQQVGLNLVMNACDAMTANAPDDRRLFVRTRSQSDELRVTVEDRGRGLPGDMATKIFEPFFTSKEHGMGLGLSVCRTILAAHGGTLSTVNNADRGAAFHFTLPAESTSNRESPANG